MDRLFKTKVGIILLSIMWGLAIPTLFKTVCKDCILIQGPSTTEANKQVYENRGKCYVFNPYIVDCNEMTKKNYKQYINSGKEL